MIIPIVLIFFGPNAYPTKILEGGPVPFADVVCEDNDGKAELEDGNLPKVDESGEEKLFLLLLPLSLE